MGKQLEALFAEVGSFYPMRENFRLTPEVQAKFTEKLRRDPIDFCGSHVASVVRTDGLKLVLADGSWVCYRLSGTEPMIRLYAEHEDRERVELILEDAARRLAAFASARGHRLRSEL